MSENVVQVLHVSDTEHNKWILIAQIWQNFQVGKNHVAQRNGL